MNIRPGILTFISALLLATAALAGAPVWAVIALAALVLANAAADIYRWRLARSNRAGG